VAVTELAVWAQEVAAELQQVEDRVGGAPDRRREQALEAALGRAYNAIHQSGALIEARAQERADAIIAAAKREAAAIVESARFTNQAGGGASANGHKPKVSRKRPPG